MISRASLTMKVSIPDTFTRQHATDCPTMQHTCPYPLLYLLLSSGNCWLYMMRLSHARRILRLGAVISDIISVLAACSKGSGNHIAGFHVYCHTTVVNSLPSAKAWAHPLLYIVLPQSSSFSRLHCEAALAGRFDATDKRHDQRAKAIYTNGDTYFGQYSNDRRQGVGLYLVAKGGGYAGSYAESKRSGQGVMRMPDGAMYQGKFAGDKFEGQGQYEYVDGSTYVGAWKAGKKHGEVCCGNCLIGSDTHT